MPVRLPAIAAAGIAIALPIVLRPAYGQDAPTATTLDPVVVTAARGPQRLADLTADVTVIGRDEVARAGAQSLAELLAAPARRPDLDERRSGIDQRRVPARRQRQPGAGADRRHACRLGHGGHSGARGHSARSHRSHRDPARAGVEPLWSGRGRRGDPGIHAPRRRRTCVQRDRQSRHLRDEPGNRGARRSVGRLEVRDPGRVPGLARFQRHRQRGGSFVESGSRRLRSRQRKCRPFVSFQCRPRVGGAVLLQPSRQPVRCGRPASTTGR